MSRIQSGDKKQIGASMTDLVAGLEKLSQDTEFFTILHDADIEHSFAKSHLERQLLDILRNHFPKAGNSHITVS